MAIGNYAMDNSPLWYLAGFLIVSAVSYGILFFRYFRDCGDVKLKYGFAVTFTISYLYLMILGSAEFRFSFVFPPLCLLILYHSFKFMIGISISSVAVNLLNVFICYFVLGRQELADCSRYAIQLLTVVGAAVFSTAAAYIYNRSFMQNVRQRAQLEQASLQIIETIANTIDAKDPYTQGHSRRVSEFSAVIAERLGYSEKEVEQIKYVAILHDVGKIAVPDSVLNKPTRLSEEEYNIMKTHTTEGARILKDISTMPGIMLGAKYHHERIDGRGYPDGIKGEEIPMIARIICLADAFDAMTSNRVYRKPLPKQAVINEIKNGRGTQFDERCVDVFMDYLKEAGDLPFEDEKGTNYVDLNNGVDKESSPDREKYDVLTGAYNSVYGEKLFSELINKGGSLLLFNIVGLKNINHEYGYVMGDYCLKIVAQTFMGSRFHSPVMRYQGNEFLVYFEDADKEEITYYVNDSINRIYAVNENDPLMKKPIDMTCGATIITDKNKPLQEYIKDLEKVLYTLKGGADNLAFYESQNSEKDSDIPDRRELEPLIDAVKKSDRDNIFFVMGDRNIDNIISHLRSNSDQELGLILFTIKPIVTDQASIEHVDEIMDTLNDTLKVILDKRGYASVYSSLQQLAVLYGSSKDDITWDKYIRMISGDVLRQFHKNYDKTNVEISMETEIIRKW